MEVAIAAQGKTKSNLDKNFSFLDMFRELKRSALEKWSNGLIVPGKIQVIFLSDADYAIIFNSKIVYSYRLQLFDYNQRRKTMKFKKIISTLMLTGVVTAVNADVCTHAPGSVLCGKGTVKSLSGNGVVTVKGTTVEGATNINGMLNAEDANFSSLNVNGSINLIQSIVSQDVKIKGALKATSSKFEKSLDIFSSSIRLINSKIIENLQIHHTENQTQKIFLENNSEVRGDIVFNDGHGKVYVRDSSKIGGNVIGGEIIHK